MRFASFVVLGLAACGSGKAPVAPSPPPAPDAAVAAPSDAGAPVPAKVAKKSPIDPCPPVKPGEISDDETPSVKGVSKVTEMVPWFEGRGVPKQKLLAFLAAYWAHGVSLMDAETYFNGSCYELAIGDRNEPALLCEQGLPEGLVAAHAIIIVVRSKRPVVVLDVGLNLLALDWPDARWLDLAFELVDSSTITLRDRAPDGTTLIAPPSECKAREARLDKCEHDWPNEPNPESYAQPTGTPGVEGLRFFRDECPLERGPDRKLHIRRAPLDSAGFSAYPATIHDCAGGRASMVRAMKQSSAGADRAEWTRELAFYDKSCTQRGTYVWKNDRFAKGPP